MFRLIILKKTSISCLIYTFCSHTTILWNVFFHYIKFNCCNNSSAKNLKMKSLTVIQGNRNDAECVTFQDAHATERDALQRKWMNITRNACDLIQVCTLPVQHTARQICILLSGSCWNAFLPREAKKTAPFWFRNSFVKPLSLLTIFGPYILQ